MNTGDRTSGGEGGIRTLDTGVSPYNGLANRRLQPLGHLSGVVEFHFTTGGASGLVHVAAFAAPGREFRFPLLWSDGPCVMLNVS